LSRVGGGVVRQAIVEGLICYASGRDQEVTLVRIDQWLPKQRKVSELEAKQILLRRYLRTYGPATLRDFSRWAGISMKDGKIFGESLQEELLEVHVEDTKGADQTGWILREDYDELTKRKLIWWTHATTNESIGTRDGSRQLYC